MGALLAALLAAFEPIIEKLIAGLGTYLMSLIAKYFPNLAAAEAQAKVSDTLDAAERITSQVTTDPVAALAAVKGKYPDFDALEAAHPGTMQMIQAHDIVMSDAQVPFAIAVHAVQIGLANGRVAAAKAAGKPLQLPK